MCTSIPEPEGGHRLRPEGVRQIAIGRQGGRGSVADRARRLTERVDPKNPGGEHTRELRAQQAIRWNAPFAVQPQAIVQELRVRLKADVDEDSAELDLVHCAGLKVTGLHA